MDRWKSRWEELEKGKEEEIREGRRKKIREEEESEEKAERRSRCDQRKVRKSQNTVFFQCFVAAEGRKAGSLKRQVRSHLVR